MEILPVIDFKQVRNTVYEMLTDRKYKITKPENIQEDLNKLYNIMNFENSLIVGENEEESIYVYFLFEKIGIKNATNIIESLIKNNIKHVILIFREGYTSFAELKLISANKEYNICIELFLEEKLKYNVTKHITQPKHIEHIKDPKMIKNILQTFNIKKKQGLLILSNDPVNRYYHGKPGEMYKVTLKGGQVDYYNIV